MKTIHSHSIPLEDVLQDLAGELGTKVHKKCGCYLVKIPAAWGQGYIQGIDFDGGLGILLYHCTFHEDVEIRFTVNEVHPLKFLFCEMGQLSHQFENSDEIHSMERLENIIVASADINGHVIRFTAKTETKINSLEINRQHFVGPMNCELRTLEKTLQALFRDVKAKRVFYHKGHYSLAMADLFAKLHRNFINHFMEYVFLKSTAYKMLFLSIHQFFDDLRDPEKKSILRTAELKCVRQAAELINNEILDFTTIPALAFQVGLNANKLQNGFKEIFHQTVNEYVQERRLDVAKGLIKNSDLSISEIVDRIGFSSKSYFSKLFRQRYGTTPSAYRKNRREPTHHQK